MTERERSGSSLPTSPVANAPTRSCTVRRRASNGIDITDRKRAEEALAESEASLRNANRMKDEFLATLSHELRTPLNAVLGGSHMLRTGKLSAESIERTLDSLERNARAQTQLVDDLLDMSRIVSGPGWPFTHPGPSSL